MAFSPSQIFSSTIEFTDCVFEDNEANDGGAMAVAVDKGNTLSFTSCQFLSNEATGYGGVIMSEDFTRVRPFSDPRRKVSISLFSSLSPSQQIVFTNCTIKENTAQTGGVGFFDWSTNITFVGSTFTSNAAHGVGGSFYLDKLASLSLITSTVSG